MGGPDPGRALVTGGLFLDSGTGAVMLLNHPSTKWQEHTPGRVGEAARCWPSACPASMCIGPTPGYLLAIHYCQIMTRGFLSEFKNRLKMFQCYHYKAGHPFAVLNHARGDFLRARTRTRSWNTCKWTVCLRKRSTALFISYARTNSHSFDLMQNYNLHVTSLECRTLLPTYVFF